MPPNKGHGSCWDTIWVPADHVNLSQTHCKQVPDFSRAQGLGFTQVNQSQYNWLPPVATYGSTWVVLWLFMYCFSGPLRSLINGPPIGVRFRESLVIRLHSEIDHIHLGIEA